MQFFKVDAFKSLYCKIQAHLFRFPAKTWLHVDKRVTPKTAFKPEAYSQELNSLISNRFKIQKSHDD